MTDLTPPPPPPPPNAPEADAQTPPPGGKGKKKLIIGGIAAALVLGGGTAAGVVAYDRLSGGGAQPHDVMPASTQAYARLDVDPSASQKIELFQLIRKFPEVAESIGIESSGQDVRKLIFDEVLSIDCPDLDYEDDVEPWLGERIGVGGEFDEERFVIAVQTTNEDEARDGIKKLFGCADEEYGIGFLDGYAILSPTQEMVDASIEDTEQATLGDSEKFTEDFEALGDQGVASAWIDAEALAEIPDLKETLGEDADQLADVGSIAATFRVDDNAVELAAISGFDQTDGDTEPTDLGTLPADTVLALSIAGVGDDISEGFDAFIEEFDSGFGELFGASALTSPEAAQVDPDGTTDDPSDDNGLSMGDELFGSGEPYSSQDFIDEIERETGIKLPEDLETLFGDSLTLAVGAENLETIPTMSGANAFSALNIALSLTTDQAKGMDLVTRIADLAGEAGIPLIAAQTDGGAVLATNQDAADAIVEPDGNLGDEDAFGEVIPNADSIYGGFFLNIGAILDKVMEADPPEEVADVVKEAQALSALGFSVSRQGDDRSLVSLRLSFKE